MSSAPVIDVPELMKAFATPEAYAHPVDAVEVHQTHISVVFLVGEFAYKIKKPVNLGFLDFSTLDQRKHFCHEEIRLNRRLAPQVYLGVVPITQNGASLRFGGDGPALEWAVKMKRLPSDATLESRLVRGEVDAAQMRALAERLASFHRSADANEGIAAFGRFAVVAANARENFTQVARQVGVTVDPVVFERVRALTEAHLTRCHDLIEARAERGVPRDTHGDLHLDHVYLFPEASPPDDLVIIDCIEFADRFRYADPVADMAFLTMDLAFHGRRDLARIFTAAYFDLTGDADGRALVPFYAAYRAVVRAKVEGMKVAEKEIDTQERQRAENRARAHWLLALGELETPINRPALVLIGGLPGTGKSTLARSLAAMANFSVLRSDVVRKELAGVAEPAPADFGAGIYSEAWTEKTYAELLQRTEQMLHLGQRVLVDANFRDNVQRQQFFELAGRNAAPFLFLHCQATPDVARSRLQLRRHDASDADWRIREQLAQAWQPVSEELRRVTQVLETSGTIAESEGQLAVILRQEELLP